MQLWSKLIDDMPLHKQELSPRLPAPEAQESDGGSSSDMDIDSSDDHGGNVCSRSLGKSIRMFDQEFGDLLAKMCTGDDDATVDKKSYLVLRNILTDFLSSVFKESIDNAAITNNVTKCKNSNSKFRVVLSEEVVNEALQMCGYSEYMRLEDSTTLMDRLIAEYVDDTVASELLAELDTLSAATSDSEDGISTGSDHE
ncbi:hypothetical protein LPJ73_001564 [Coemansia sp. RSA 2703]|nr:hypothetical protein LPJ73_001564 [Coemansia sp. RSA 2703]KAJ2371725.1 hypothetical protein IW150_004462 [Coemansia sp. RSA 2607]